MEKQHNDTYIIYNKIKNISIWTKEYKVAWYFNKCLNILYACPLTAYRNVYIYCIYPLTV